MGPTQGPYIYNIAWVRETFGGVWPLLTPSLFCTLVTIQKEC